MYILFYMYILYSVKRDYYSKIVAYIREFARTFARVSSIARGYKLDALEGSSEF